MNKQTIYLAGGCFWGTQKYCDNIKGVLSTTVGYANGHLDHPTYHQVRYENTGHTETVKVEYDADVISLTVLLELFYKIIDPTSLDKQGVDAGHNYRTGVYWTNPEDEKVVLDSLKQLQKKYDKKVVVEALPLENFFDGEEYHQKYLDKNPNGYCHVSLQEMAWVKTVDPATYHEETKKPKLVICDVDMTLSYMGQITAHTIEVMEKMHKEGILFGIASGRIVEELERDALERWKLSFKPDIVVGLNGSTCKDNIDNVRYDDYLLSKETIEYIVKAMKPADIPVRIYYGQKNRTTFMTQAMLESSRKHGMEVEIVDEATIYSEDNAKLMYLIKEGQDINEVRKLAESIQNEHCKVVQTNERMLEFVHPEVSKAVALKWFCQRHDIDYEDVMAFGDSENDEEMMKTAGWSACLANGQQRTKDIAKDVTRYDCGHEGFADYIERHVLCTD